MAYLGSTRTRTIRLPSRPTRLDLRAILAGAVFAASFGFTAAVVLGLLN